MEAKTKKRLVTGAVIAAVIIIFLVVSSQNADAANVNSQASQDFDNYIAKANNYAASQGVLTRAALNAGINYAVSNKAVIIQKSVADGKTIAEELSTWLPASVATAIQNS